MRRIERIRHEVVSKYVSTDGWWEAGPVARDPIDCLLRGKQARQIQRDSNRVRRQIVDRLLDQASRLSHR